MRQHIQRHINYSHPHYITFYAVQSHRVDEKSLIFGGININIRTDNSYPFPPLLPLPKITHVVE